MNLIDAEIDALVTFGASQGQIEHHLIEIGYRDPEEPSQDGEWWWLHRDQNPACCGPNYPDGYAPRLETRDSQTEES